MEENALESACARETILLASHNQGDIDALCDTVCEMDAGAMTAIRGYEG